MVYMFIVINIIDADQTIFEKIIYIYKKKYKYQ